MKTPQNISALLGRIGEDLVLFQLYTLTHDKDSLEIYKNFSEAGYDLGINNLTNGNRIRIEVKTRQHLVTSNSALNTIHFTLTENEYNSCDFLIGYWLEKSTFFIVPKRNLVKTKSGSKHVFKFVTNYLKNRSYSDKGFEYINNWSQLINTLNQ